MRCLISSRFSMEAEILHWEGITTGGTTDVTQGSFGNTYQDPITGETLYDWKPGVVDNPSTPDVNEGTSVRTVPCLARGIVDGGIRVAGTTERFGDTYENVDFVKMWVPANVVITKRDRVTNIREARTGRVVWTNEESDGSPTVYNVDGVTPLFDAWNRHVENYVLLERANNNGEV